MDLPMADRHETVLAPAPEDLVEQLQRAEAAPEGERLQAIGEVVGADPTFLAGWAALAALGREPIERYAYARVGYHRGLDALRGSGWGGTGLVRWSQPSNRPFLRCVVRLRAAEPSGPATGGVIRGLRPAERLLAGGARVVGAGDGARRDAG